MDSPGDFRQELELRVEFGLANRFRLPGQRSPRSRIVDVTGYKVDVQVWHRITEQLVVHVARPERPLDHPGDGVDVAPVRRAKMMGNPWLIHIIVIGSGLLIHGGSAEGAMAAIVSGVFSALYVRYQQRFYGYIRNNQWHPGVFRVRDPRQGLKS